MIVVSNNEDLYIGGMFYDSSAGGYISGSELVSHGPISNSVEYLPNVFEIDDAVVISGGGESVDLGGVASGTVVSNGGHLLVFGLASDAVVNSGGYIAVESGGVASGSVVRSGAEAYLVVTGVNTPNLIDGCTLQSGVFLDLYVQSGGSVVDVVLSGAGSDDTAFGGYEDVQSGGVANGTIIRSGGYEIVDSGGSEIGPTIDGGVLALEPGDLLGTAAITFGGSGGTLSIGGGTSYLTEVTNPISGFAAGDTIDLSDVSSVTGVVWSAGVLAISEGGGGNVIDLALPGAFANAQFSFGADASFGTDISLGPTVSDYLLASELAYDLTLPGYSTDTASFVASLASAGFTAVSVAGNTNANGMAAEAFLDAAANEVIVAFRGTVFSPKLYPAITYQDLYSIDGKGIVAVNPAMMSPVFSAAIAFVESVHAAYPSDDIFLTGHSLGGTEAEAVAADLAGSQGFRGGATFAATGVTNLLSGPASTVNNLTDYVITNDPVATFSNDSVGNITNGPGAHVGTIVQLSPTVLGSVEGVGASYLVDTVSTMFNAGLLTGALSAGLLHEKNINIAAGVFGLPQHFLANYGNALVNAGDITSNPLQAATRSESSSSISDLSSLFSGIQDLAVNIDAAGDLVQSGVLSVATSLGEAVVDLRETLTAAGSAVFSMVIDSGKNVAEQLLTVTGAGILSNVITIDGTQIDTPDITSGDPASLNIAADGSILVGVSAPTAGDEITVSDSPGGVATIATGGDATDPSDQIDQIGLPADEMLNIGAVTGGQVPAVSLTLDPTPLVDNFLGDGVSDALIENAAGAVVAGEVENGQMIYTQIAGLGSEWSFRGTGDFLGDGGAEFLIENAAGSVVVGEVANGQANYTAVAGLGPEWSFEGTGDFLGDGQSDFLIENTNGAVVVGEVLAGQAQYSQVAALGPEWKFVGAGDFLGDGKSDFLIENTSGAVVVGEVVNGQAHYTLATVLGPEWKFVETGDFLGGGRDQFLIENTAGALVVGEVSGGVTNFTAVGGLGPEWSFVGAGDYYGTGKDSFLMENISGAVVTGTVVNGQAQYAQVGALGAEWRFHG